MGAKSEYHTDKYAIETVSPAGRVRFMEIFGKNAAYSTAKSIRDYWKRNDPRNSVEVIQIQDENGWL